MIAGGHRVAAFAGGAVGVEWNGARAGAVAAVALGGLADADDRLPDEIFRVGAHPGSSLLTLFHGHTCLYRGESTGAAAHLLLQAALDRLIGDSSGGLVMHAAVLGRGSAAVLLPGATGSGKTMLSAWLTLRGLAPLSDEACYLVAPGAAVEGFARPFCFKGAWAELLGLDPLPARDVLQDDLVSLVPRDVLCAAAPAPVTPRLIVFPRYDPSAPFALTRLTPARAAVRVIETVANARNLPDHGLGRVAELVRNVDSYSLTYGRFAQLDALVDLLATLP